MSTDAINKLLFSALQARFGKVAIANEGQDAIVRYTPDWDKPGLMQAEIIEAGEYYRVNCLWCNDTRQRLYVNHRWNTWDERTGDDNLHLMHCFNENCVKTRQQQVQLQHMLLLPARQMPTPRRRQSFDLPPQQVFTLPNGCTPANELVATHPAAKYLLSRGFDPQELWQRWQVLYCECDTNAQPPIHRRIIVPVYRPRVFYARADSQYHETILAGWQARVVGTPDADVPKYLCCRAMAKSRLLYGLPAAMDSTGPVIVCEGPTDVWRLQAGAVALFGKSLSLHQKNLLATRFGDRPIVVLLDSDAADAAKHIQRDLAIARQAQPGGGDKRVVIARLPEGGKDPADFSREQVLACVERAMA